MFSAFNFCIAKEGTKRESTNSSSREIPKIKYGKVTPHDFRYRCDFDTTASAVILYKKGIMNRETFTFTTFKRIKILNKEGLKLAKLYLTGNKYGIKSNVYSLTNGQIVKTKCSSFSQKQTATNSQKPFYRVDLNNIEVGSIIDLTYKQNGYPETFFFQDTIPTKLVQLYDCGSCGLRYQKRKIGEDYFHSISLNNYIGYNIPAFSSEPYINSPNNYISSIAYDYIRYNKVLKNVSFTKDYLNYHLNNLNGIQKFTSIYEYRSTLSEAPYSTPLNINKKYFDSVLQNYMSRVTYISNAERWSDFWVQINDIFCTDMTFNNTIEGKSTYLDNTVNEISSTYHDHMKKLQAAYEYVINLKQNSFYNTISSKQEIPYYKNDNDSNILIKNFVLIQLLKRLNISCKPVVLRLKSNGLLDINKPSFNQLDHLIVQVQINGNSLLIDCNDKSLPLGILPEECLNEFGHTIASDGGEVVDLRPLKKDLERTAYELELNNDLSLTGNIKSYHFDYNGHNFRKAFFQAESQEDFISKNLIENNDIEIRTAEILNLDSIYKPIIENYEVKINNAVSEKNDQIMINPFLCEQIKDNPFQQEERNYPISLPYPKEMLFISQIALPNGFQVEALPESFKIVLEDKGVAALISYQLKDNSITTTFVIKQNKIFYLPNEYQILKEFYQQIVEKQTKKIVLKRI